jgi:hypothetical protein
MLMRCAFIAHKKSAETKTEKTDRKMLKLRLIVLCVAPLRVEGGYELIFVDCCIVMERSSKYSKYVDPNKYKKWSHYINQIPVIFCSGSKQFPQ